MPWAFVTKQAAPPLASGWDKHRLYARSTTFLLAHPSRTSGRTRCVPVATPPPTSWARSLLPASWARLLRRASHSFRWYLSLTYSGWHTACAPPPHTHAVCSRGNRTTHPARRTYPRGRFTHTSPPPAGVRRVPSPAIAYTPSYYAPLRCCWPPLRNCLRAAPASGGRRCPSFAHTDAYWLTSALPFCHLLPPACSDTLPSVPPCAYPHRVLCRLMTLAIALPGYGSPATAPNTALRTIKHHRKRTIALRRITRLLASHLLLTRTAYQRVTRTRLASAACANWRRNGFACAHDSRGCPWFIALPHRRCVTCSALWYATQHSQPSNNITLLGHR